MNEGNQKTLAMEQMEGLEKHLIMVVEWQLNPISMYFRLLAINHN